MTTAGAYGSRGPAQPHGTAGLDATHGRAWLWLSSAWRYPLRWGYRSLGSIERRLAFRGWWPFAKVLLAVVLFLTLVPVALHYVVAVLDDAGVTEKWGIGPAPDVNDWLTPSNVGLLFLLGMFMRWLSRARQRVLIEGFIDHTKEDATAVSGLSTLLVTELTRLQELYRQVSADAVPTAVGTEQQGGFGRGKEAAPFLTVSADSVGDVLEGAVASDARLELGPAKIPIGPMLGLLNRVVRGPRVVGSVHRTEASGGPTLTAQLVGVTPSGTWRVDHVHEPESAAERRAFLDTMVRELACRMFTELTLGATVRWQAVQDFNEYLRLYGESMRTPRDRANYLKQAQGKLLEAVAKDETFDLAYYNVGVTYTQLAHAELTAERSSDDLTAPTEFRRESLDEARREAADVAFLKATERNPARWEGHYALAVTRLSAIEQGDIEQEVSAVDRDRLYDVIRRCEHALAVRPPPAAAGTVNDLLGMAQTRVGDFRAAMRSHRRAVWRSWIELCRAERVYRARPNDGGERLDRARSNTVAALHNMGLARARRAEMRGLRGQYGKPLVRDRLAAARTFRAAIGIAGGGTSSAAAAHFERARVLEKCGRFRAAEKDYEAAERIHPRNSEYLACHARTVAASAASEAASRPRAAEARALATRALATRAFRVLGPPYARSVIPFTPKALDARCEATLKALQQAFAILAALPAGDPDQRGVQRVLAIARLRQELECRCDPQTGYGGEGVDAAITALEQAEQRWSECCAAFAAAGASDPDWELTQVQIALTRLYARATTPCWEKARERLQLLIERLDDSADADLLIALDVRARCACALRNCGEQVGALTAAADCVRRDPLSIEGRREAGRAHFALCQYDDALDAWHHALFLNPSDAYLHFEMAMCHRRIAEQRGPSGRADQLSAADAELAQALALFDGEDLDGAAWTRVWRGRIALERGYTEQAISHLEAAAHGTAAAVAPLYLAEALLRANRYQRAEHELERGHAALREGMVGGTGDAPIDARWGDDLPTDAYHARRLRALAEARYMAPGDWQDKHEVDSAWKLLEAARGHAERIGDERIREDCLALILESETRMLRARNRLDDALARAHDLLRIRPTSQDFLLEAELLELLVASAGKSEQRRELLLALLAVERAWHEAEASGDGGGAPVVDPRQRREQLRRVIELSARRPNRG